AAPTADRASRSRRGRRDTPLSPHHGRARSGCAPARGRVSTSHHAADRVRPGAEDRRRRSHGRAAGGDRMARLVRRPVRRAREPASPADAAWVSPRLEYAVSVATRLSAEAQDGVTLSASEFDGGRLDWSSFDINDTRTVDTTGDKPFAPVNETTVPSPVTFPG